MNRISSDENDNGVPLSTPQADPPSDPLTRAALERTRARAQFETELRRASAAGQSAVHHAWSSTRPAVLGLTVLGAAMATLALVAAVRTFRRRPAATLVIRHVGEPPVRRGRVLRVVARSLAFILARKVASKVLERLDKRIVAWEER